MKEAFELAVSAIGSGDVDNLNQLLADNPELATTRGDDEATLLIRLIDYPGHRPNSAESARVLIEAGADVDARRNAENGTALAGAICVNDADVVRVLLELGADIHAPCGWRDGTVLDLVDERCGGLHHTEFARTIQDLFTTTAGRRVPNRAAIGGTVPLLFVSDFEASLSYYTDKVGFRLVWRNDESADDPYGSIIRGDTDFHITICHCEDKGHVGKLDVRIETREIDVLFEEMKAAEVLIGLEPKDQPWGLREFEINDADGNKITFFSTE